MSRISLGKFINQTALLWCSFTRTGQISWPQTTPAFIFCFSAITNKFSLSISTFLFPSHLPIFSSKHLFSFNHSKLMQSGVKEQQLALGSCVQFKNWHLAGVKPSSSSHHPRPRSLWAKLFPFGRGCRCSTKQKKSPSCEYLKISTFSKRLCHSHCFYEQFHLFKWRKMPVIRWYPDLPSTLELALPRTAPVNHNLKKLLDTAPQM